MTNYTIAKGFIDDYNKKIHSLNNKKEDEALAVLAQLTGISLDDLKKLKASPNQAESIRSIKGLFETFGLMERNIAELKNSVSTLTSITPDIDSQSKQKLAEIFKELTEASKESADVSGADIKNTDDTERVPSPMPLEQIQKNPKKESEEIIKKKKKTTTKIEKNTSIIEKLVKESEKIIIKIDDKYRELSNLKDNNTETIKKIINNIKKLLAELKLEKSSKAYRIIALIEENINDTPTIKKIIEHINTQNKQFMSYVFKDIAKNIEKKLAKESLSLKILAEKESDNTNKEIYKKYFEIYESLMFIFDDISQEKDISKQLNIVIQKIDLLNNSYEKNIKESIEDIIKKILIIIRIKNKYN